MPRNPHEPLYRPILREAFVLAWREKRLWPLAFIAGLCLTGSLYDVIWRLRNSLSPESSFANMLGPVWGEAMTTWSHMSLTDTVLGGLAVFQITAFMLIIVFAILALSVSAQGALVFALGMRRRDKAPSIKEALTVGARALWPVLVLNIFSIAALWATRSLIAIALSQAVLDGSAASYLIYLLAFLVFVVIAVAIVIIQIFSLNAMILQGATLAQAIERAAEVLANHWVVIVETSAILFAISVGSWVLAIAVNMVLSVPLFMLMVIAVVLNSNLLLYMVLYIGIALFVCSLLTISAFVVQLQYATWAIMYRRMGEGGVMPKIHRWVRALTHGYHVPGA